MTPAEDTQRQLEQAVRAIEALDAARAAGALTEDEHGRKRAEHEREAGRLYASLRRAQRVAGAPAPGPAGALGRAPGRRWTRPVVLVPAAVLLVGVGIGSGVTVARWRAGAPGAAAPAGMPLTAAGGLPSGLMKDIELRALRQAADRDDAPIAGLLQLAHLELDGGRLAEARRLYQRVLAREPGDAEAITHLGAVLYHEGRIDEALAKVEEALRIDPRYIHAHWDRTQYLFHAKHDFAAAIKAAEAFLAVVPDGPDADSIRALMAEARAKLAGATPAAPKPR